VVGTVLVASAGLIGSNTPAGLFLSSVNRSVIISMIIAGAISLVLGTILFLQITTPLRQLKKASNAISHGDFSQRVNNHSRDELGELSQAFNQMAGNLERAETNRQHLMADIAHELRTPLAVIQANLEGMLDEVLPLNIEQVANLHDQTLLLNRMVADLRLLSLAEAGQLKLERQETRIENLVNKVVDQVKFLAQQKSIKIRIDLAIDLPPVWIDPDRITQVLNNLVSNALRYTPQDGIITIAAARSSTQSDLIQVSVTDSGPGIDSADLPYILDRFYRVDKSRRRDTGGSGLGLAIVRQLVEAHGGKVEAASPIFVEHGQPGSGTRITLTLQTFANSKLAK